MPPISNQCSARESMTALKNTGIRLAALLVFQTLWVETSHSQVPASPAFGEELSKQESIYQSKGEQVPEGYSIDRSLVDYTRALTSEFDPALARLGPEDRWLDIGAGSGQAILDYYTPDYDLTHWEGRERRGRKAQAVALSIEDRRTPRWQQDAASLGAGKIEYIFNRRLREYSLEELGQFQVMTDVIGGFSYTENLSLFVEKVLGFLDLYGSFFTLLQDVRSEDGTNRPHYAGAPFLTEIANAEGSEVSVCAWLKSITCVQVSCEFKTSWKPPIEAFRIRKVCNDVTVPALVPIHYVAGTPPERRFQLRNPTPASPGRTSATP
jgi:hypothetical protein